MTNNKITKQQEMENRIFTIRGVQVMFDSHLAEIYGVESNRFNEQGKQIAEEAEINKQILENLAKLDIKS